MRTHTCTAVLLSLLLIPSARADAQSTPAPRDDLKAAVAAAARDPRAPALARQPGQAGSRDSVANGTLIGAAIGAAALGVIGGAICAAQHEPGTRSCWSDTFRIAAIGAAIGGGAGLAIDAATTRQRGVRVALRVRF